MSLVIMYVVLLLCALWCLYAVYSRRKHGHELPPAYPGALPILGHTHLLLLWCRDLYGFANSMADFCLKSGGVTYGYFAGNICYGVVDPEDAATVSNSLLQRHPFLNFAKHVLGEGLMVGHGEKYKLHRRLLNPAFSLTAVNGFLGIFNEQSRRLVDLLDSHVGQGSVDPIMMFRSVTLSATCATVFGDTDVKENDFLNKYITTLDTLFETIEQRVARFWLHNDTIFNWSSLKKKQDKLCDYMNEITNEVIQRKKIDLKSSVNLGNLNELDGGFKSFIDIMLEIAEKGALSYEDVQHELNTIVVTSYETSSQQLIFVASILGTFPEVQEKMYKEIMEVIGNRDVEKQDIPKLVYTDAVIKECQRFIPLLPLVPRYVDKELKLKNYTLRAGTMAFFMPVGINKHPAWGPDVHVFRPERWLDKAMQPKLANLNFAFSLGPRSCVGRRYAMTALKVTLAYIVRQFRIRGDYTKIKYSVDIVIRAASGHEITVERRSTKCDMNHNIPLSIFEERKDDSHGARDYSVSLQ